MAKIIKDDSARRLFYTIIDSAAGSGIPVGNLTSQYFANQYLSRLFLPTSRILAKKPDVV